MTAKIRGRARRSNRGAMWLGGLAVGLSLATGAMACDTPVYRYAMYRWAPAPYTIYYFHRSEPSKADQAVNALLSQEPVNGANANVSLTAVDLTKKDALDVLPDVVKKAWQSHAKDPGATHLVVSPWGEQVFAGKLDLASARAMIQSPMRKQISELLDNGCGVVLLILNGSDTKENARVEAVARDVAKKAAAGEIGDDSSQAAPEMEEKKNRSEPQSAGLGETGPRGRVSPKLDSPREETAKSGGIKIGVITLDRTNAAEQWFLRNLTAIDPENEKRASEPMLFAMYGRGRAMPPGIGKEVNAESLTSLVSFLAGHCSCTVKDQNPGVDLLVQWDWEATAEKYAKEDEAAVKQEDAVVAQTSDVAVAAPVVARSPDRATATTTGLLAGATRSGDRATTTEAPAPTTGVVVPASNTAPVGSHTVIGQGSVPSVPAPSFFTLQAWGIIATLVGMVAVVVVAGFVLLRKSQHGSS